MTKNRKIFFDVRIPEHLDRCIRIRIHRTLNQLRHEDKLREIEPQPK
jgi:hypothetical protein